jgi:hypothetical protein
VPFPIMPEPTSIPDIAEALDRVHYTYKDHFFYMDFFFCYKNKKVRTIFNVIRSLPNILFRTDPNDPHPSVSFQSTWTNVNLNTPLVRNPAGGGRPLRRGEAPKNYFAHSIMGIPMVSQINLFDWGFEILSDSGIDMIGILSKYLENPSIAHIQSLVGQTMWSVPPVLTETDKSLRYYWRKLESDDFDNFIMMQQHGAVAKQQQPTTKKSLVLDSEMDP